MTVWIGTSGWQYRHWRGRFYPEGLAQKRWLEHYAERFDTVESNAAFYRLPERATFEQWARRSPQGFVWSVKMSRFLTHVRRLRDPEEPAARFLERVEGLGGRLAAVLLQLPPTLQADPGLLDRVLRALGSLRVAVEFRHPSWFSDETRGLLERRGAALCLADRGSRPASPLWRTASWGYLRLHEGGASPHPCYGRDALRSWAGRLAELFGAEPDVYVYFNNDARGCALRDARTFASECRRAGLRPTRVPRESVPV